MRGNRKGEFRVLNQSPFPVALILDVQRGEGEGVEGRMRVPADAEGSLKLAVNSLVLPANSERSVQYRVEKSGKERWFTIRASLLPFGVASSAGVPLVLTQLVHALPEK